MVTISFTNTAGYSFVDYFVADNLEEAKYLANQRVEQLEDTHGSIWDYEILN